MGKIYCILHTLNGSILIQYVQVEYTVCLKLECSVAVSFCWISLRAVCHGLSLQTPCAKSCSFNPELLETLHERSCKQWPILREVWHTVNALTVDLWPTQYFGCRGYHLRSFGLHWQTALCSDAFWVCLCAYVCVWCTMMWKSEAAYPVDWTDRISPFLPVPFTIPHPFLPPPPWTGSLSTGGQPILAQHLFCISWAVHLGGKTDEITRERKSEKRKNLKDR